MALALRQTVHRRVTLHQSATIMQRTANRIIGPVSSRLLGAVAGLTLPGSLLSCHGTGVRQRITPSLAHQDAGGLAIA